MHNVNQYHRDTMSYSQRIASWITQRIGTMPFFYLIFTWTIIWLLWNTLAPQSSRFDPAPDFLLWLFLSNMIQIFLMPLLMIGQNIQGKHSELLAENDFAVNQKAEEELRSLHVKIDRLTALVEQLQRQS